MILIDSDAEIKLVQALNHYLHTDSEAGSISFTFPSQKIRLDTLYEQLPPVVQATLDNPECKLYFCEAGEVFIVSPGLHARLAHKLALAVARAFDLTTLECEFHFYDLSKDTNRLLAILEPRLEKKEQAEKNAKAAQLAQAQAERASVKRQAILNTQVSEHHRAAIGTRRAERKVLEIMVIEDDAFSRRLMGNLLGKDYRLTSLENAESALPTYAHLAPDILFLDINLPNVSGHELLERILQLDPQAYIIMLSGNCDKENVLQAMRQGAQGFVAKPFTPDKLHQYIKRCPTFTDRRTHAYH